MATGTPTDRHSKKSEAENCINELSMRDFSASLGATSGRPIACWSLLSGGGPGRMSLALLQPWHGVPVQTAATRPSLTHPSRCVEPGAE